MVPTRFLLATAVIAASAYPGFAHAQSGTSPARTLTGAAAFGDWRADAPGTRRHITPADLPAPYATPSARNSVRVVAKPGDAQLRVPQGFDIKPFATAAQGLDKPRLLTVAPNGDIFVAETNPGRIRVLRPTPDGTAVAQSEVFASGLARPFGIAFYPTNGNPQWVYIGNTDSVVRFPYRGGDLKASGPAETIVPALPTGGHYTRNVVFSRDGTKMFVSVGSGSNVGEDIPRLDPAALQKWVAENPLGAAWGNEAGRADVLVFDPAGKNRRIYATGIRNCVGMAVDSGGTLWCSTNERDGLGEDLVPDYITRVREGAFYGWPWFYLGNHEDPRHKDTRADLRDKITVPDVLVQAHSASLQMAIYEGSQFPADYTGSIFAAEHGSWNRAKRTGYKIIRALVKDGVPTGEYEDFVTGFGVDDSSAWGRPVGIAVAKDGALLFSEDGNGTIWRVSHSARASAR
jgi:glucose/arabinose dehydrogenase